MWGPILYLIIFILAMALLWKLLKSVFKLVLIGLLILLISIGAFSFFLIRDINDIQKNLPTRSNLALIDDNGTIVYAAKIIGLASLEERENPFIMLSKQEVDNISNFYIKNDMKSVKGDNYKVFIVKMKVIEDALPDQIEMPKDSKETKKAADSKTANISGQFSKWQMPNYISKTDLLALIRSDNPNLIIADITTRHLSNPTQIESVKAEIASSPDMTNENIKGMALGLSGNEIMKKGIGYLFSELKNEDISIYPKPLIINVLKFMPSSLIDKFISVPDVTGDSEAAEE